MCDIDLDINNYELQDILNLFKMPEDFNEQQLKRAKQIVLRTHPDKCGLPSDYFRFYSKAYKVLYSLWEFKKRGDVDNGHRKNTEYISEIEDENRSKVLDNFFKSKEEFKNKNNFNSWFNEQFEKTKIKNDVEEKGYQDWLKSNEDMETEPTKSANVAIMKQEFDKLKVKAREKAMIVKEDIHDMLSYSNVHATELSGEVPSSFNSDMFSDLQYQDLYQAHSNSVIPVTDEDYDMIPKYKNVNEFMTHRSIQDVQVKPLCERDAEQYLNNKNKLEETRSVKRAFELAKQSELAKQKNKEFWTSLQLLER